MVTDKEKELEFFKKIATFEFSNDRPFFLNKDDMTMNGQYKS